MKIKENSVILFQGDSITDAGRARDFGDNAIPANDPNALGKGYVANIASRLLADHPRHGLQIHNRGVSGNRITNMRDRWQADCLDLAPDILSILIGVNDTWHGVASGSPENGVAVDAFEVVYRQLFEDTRKALPALDIVICEPFTTEAGAVLSMHFHPDIDERRARVAAVAADFDAHYVPFQDMFDYLSETADPAYWAGDGVHPSAAGHEMMARFWLENVLAS